MALIKLKHIDKGNGFDFGKSSGDYAKFRDIYPPSFYNKLVMFGIGQKDQHILDLGTGTGVVPRAMYSCGAKFTGIDIAPGQIEQAKELSKGMDIDYKVCPADETGFEQNSFDAAMAVQCFWYFNQQTAIPEIHRILKPGGRFAILYMIGLPRESEILAKSEELVLKYNPEWSSGNWDRKKLEIPSWLGEMFYTETLHTYFEDVEFTRESWCGRMRACRGVGASLPENMVALYDKEHHEALEKIAGETFTIPHQIIMEIFRVIK